jgi:hypothetical protein
MDNRQYGLQQVRQHPTIGMGWTPWITLQQISFFRFGFTVIVVGLLHVYKSPAMVTFEFITTSRLEFSFSISC